MSGSAQAAPRSTCGIVQGYRFRSCDGRAEKDISGAERHSRAAQYYATRTGTVVAVSLPITGRRFFDRSVHGPRGTELIEQRLLAAFAAMKPVGFARSDAVHNRSMETTGLKRPVTPCAVATSREGLSRETVGPV